MVIRPERSGLGSRPCRRRPNALPTSELADIHADEEALLRRARSRCRRRRARPVPDRCGGCGALGPPGQRPPVRRRHEDPAEQRRLDADGGPDGADGRGLYEVRRALCAAGADVVVYRLRGRT
ncbi:hypothetical protein ACU686_01940 [Yinghuangia aomiensis]